MTKPIENFEPTGPTALLSGLVVGLGLVVVDAVIVVELDARGWEPVQYMAIVLGVNVLGALTLVGPLEQLMLRAIKKLVERLG